MIDDDTFGSIARAPSDAFARIGTAETGLRSLDMSASLVSLMCRMRRHASLSNDHAVRSIVCRMRDYLTDLCARPYAIAHTGLWHVLCNDWGSDIQGGHMQTDMNEPLGPLHSATALSLRHTLAKAQEDHAKRALSVRYSIYFESRELLDATQHVVTKFFDGASMYPVIGFSDGVAENSIVVDIVGAPEDKTRVLGLAKALKSLHMQREVLVTWSTVSSILV